MNPLLCQVACPHAPRTVVGAGADRGGGGASICRLQPGAFRARHIPKAPVPGPSAQWNGPSSSVSTYSPIPTADLPRTNRRSSARPLHVASTGQIQPPVFDVLGAWPFFLASQRAVFY